MPDHTCQMGAEPSDLRLGVLTNLGRRLPAVSNTEEAALEVVRALAPLHVAASVSTVQADMAVVIAINVPPGLGTRVSSSMGSRLLGMSIPLDGIESLRNPVRLRRPYCGVAGAAETLRSLTTDSGFAQALPTASDELEVIAVPVVVGDQVVAVISIWGPGSTSDLIPMLEVVAVMLAAASVTKRR